jgi:hypothetical protein
MRHKHACLKIPQCGRSRRCAAALAACCLAFAGAGAHAQPAGPGAPDPAAEPRPSIELMPDPDQDAAISRRLGEISVALTRRGVEPSGSDTAARDIAAAPELEQMDVSREDPTQPFRERDAGQNLLTETGPTE